MEEAQRNYDKNIWNPIEEEIARVFNAEEVSMSITSITIDDLIYYPKPKLRNWLETYVQLADFGRHITEGSITLEFRDDGYVSAQEL